jgi:hypothetical protein
VPSNSTLGTTRARPRYRLTALHALWQTKKKKSSTDLITIDTYLDVIFGLSRPAERRKAVLRAG